jgi:hypothetical protein
MTGLVWEPVVGFCGGSDEHEGSIELLRIVLVPEMDRRMKQKLFNL